MGYRKFKIIIAMILTLTISVGINAYALQKIEIVPAKYDTGAPATTLSNGSSVSMTSGKQVGYKVYFAESPSTLKIRLGCYAKSQATIEVWLDGVDTGVKIGTVVTEPTTAWTTLEYEIPFNTEAKGEHMLYVK